MTAPPKRHWFQFSLKAMLIGMTVLCVGPGGYVAYEQAKARRQEAAVEAIEKLGGSVEYGRDGHERSATMRLILGDDSFGNVDRVSFAMSNPRVTDDSLVHVANLNKLERLWLASTLVTDKGLVHLARLRNLKLLGLANTIVSDAGLREISGLINIEKLWLDNTQVTDAGLVHLTRLTKLTYLSLQGTQVTDAGVAELQKVLPNCRIVR